MSLIPLRNWFVKVDPIDVQLKKVLGSNKVSSGNKNYKYFICYLYIDHKFESLHIMLPKTSAYVVTKWTNGHNGQNKRMYFLIEDNDVLEKYNTSSDKVSVDI